MAKYLLLLCGLTLLFVPQAGAENHFRQADLAEAVRQLAEAEDEQVVFLTRPEGKVAASPGGEGFEMKLSELLSGTDFRFTRKNDYYLIGEFDPGSVEFAAHSERLIHDPTYLTAQQLAERISFPNLRVETVGSGHLLLEGLPKDLADARDALKALDSEDNPYQVKFEMTVLDLQQIESEEFEIGGFQVFDDIGKSLEFVAAGPSLDLLPAHLLDRLEVTAARSSRNREVLVRPSLVTHLGESGSLAFSEEVIRTGPAAAGLLSTGLEIAVTPLRMSKNDGRIKAAVELSRRGSREFYTTTWIGSGEETLLGFLYLSEGHSHDSTFRTGQRGQQRKFALYMSAEPVGTLTSSRKPRQEWSPAVSLDGLDRLLFPERVEPGFDPVPSQRYQLISDGKEVIDLDVFIEEFASRSSLEVIGRGESDYLSLGVDLPISEGLKLGGRFMRWADKSPAVAASLSDRFRLSPVLSLGVGYYPAVFYPLEGWWRLHHGWAQLEYFPGPFFLSLRFSSGLEPQPLRVEIGAEMSESLYLLVAASGDLQGVNRYLTGIRLDF